MKRIFIALIVVIIINAVGITSVFSQVGMWVKKQDIELRAKHLIAE